MERDGVCLVFLIDFDPAFLVARFELANCTRKRLARIKYGGVLLINRNLFLKAAPRGKGGIVYS